MTNFRSSPESNYVDELLNSCFHFNVWCFSQVLQRSKKVQVPLLINILCATYATILNDSNFDRANLTILIDFKILPNRLNAPTLVTRMKNL